MGRCRRHRQCVPPTARDVTKHRRTGRNDCVCLGYIVPRQYNFNTYSMRQTLFCDEFRICKVLPYIATGLCP
jgi:hypothetical protein